MTIPASLTFYMELGLEVLLALTLCYCVILERRLAAVRKGQEGLSRTIGELNMAISGAGASLRALKAAAGEAAQTLDEQRLPLNRIMNLEVGQTIMLGASPDSPIELRCGGVGLFKGRMGRRNNHIAVRCEAPLTPSAKRAVQTTGKGN